VQLSTIAKNQGDDKRTMQFYTAPEGVNLAAIPQIVRWDVISAETLSGNRIAITRKIAVG